MGTRGHRRMGGDGEGWGLGATERMVVVEKGRTQGKREMREREVQEAIARQDLYGNRAAEGRINVQAVLQTERRNLVLVGVHRDDGTAVYGCTRQTHAFNVAKIDQERGLVHGALGDCNAELRCARGKVLLLPDGFFLVVAFQNLEGPCTSHRLVAEQRGGMRKRVSKGSARKMIAACLHSRPGSCVHQGSLEFRLRILMARRTQRVQVVEKN